MLPDTFKDPNVCIIGLGYVGLTLAVAMAEAGFSVEGVERDQKVLDALATGRAHFSEAGLDSVLADQIAAGRFSFNKGIKKDTKATVFIVTVGTPVGNDKRTQFAGLMAVTNMIADVLKDGDLVILRSTVRIGTSRDTVKPVLDATGRNYQLAFCPERTLEGKALVELRSLPQIVGGVDAASTFRASQIFSFLTPSVVRVNDLETAEMVKLVNNTQRDFVFAFANEVAAMCDAVGISAKEVIDAGNLGYPRANLPLPGPVGGPCLEKDPYILAEGLERYGFVPSLSLAGRRWNESLPTRVAAEVSREFERIAKRSARKVVIAGVAFKGRPATSDLRGTLAAPLIDALRTEFPDATLFGWDAVASEEDVATLGVETSTSLEAAFAEADVVVVQNNHEVFGRMNIGSLASSMANDGIIYDLWNQHNARHLQLPNRVTYRGLGALNLNIEAR